MSSRPAERPATQVFPARMPPLRAGRISLFEREVRERLAGPALELLLDGARVLSEGGRAATLPRPDGSRGPDPFFGSTMLTLELAALTDRVREPADEPTARRVAALLSVDARAGRAVRRMAEREARRIAGAPVRVAGWEVRVRAAGAAVQVDVDLEGVVEAPPGAGGGAGRAD